MSARRSTARKLAFEQLENKTSLTAAMLDVDHADALDAVSEHARTQRTVDFLRFVDRSLGYVSIARELPSPSEVAAADSMLIHERLPNHEVRDQTR